MAITVVKNTVATNSAGVSSLSVTVTAPASGNSFVVGIYAETNSIALSSVTDNQSNSYSINAGPFVVSDAFKGTDLNRAWFAECSNITNGPTTVTANLASSLPATTNFIVCVWEVNALPTSSAFDFAINSGFNITSTSPNILFSNSYADEAIFSIVGFNGGGTTFTPQSGMTVDYLDSSWSSSVSFCHQIFSVAGTQNDGGTLNIAKPWNVAAALYNGLGRGTAGAASGPSVYGMS